MSLTIAELMDKMPIAFIPEKAQGVDVVVHFKFTGEEAGEWNAVIADGKCEVAQGAPQKEPNMSLMADSVDFVKIFTGELDGMQAFMQGKVRFEGNMSFAMKLTQMFKIK